MLFSINDIFTGTLKIICIKDICNSAVGLNTALLQIFFFWEWNLWKHLSKIVRFFIGNPKICLFGCFANTCIPPETPKRGILLFGSPGRYGLFWWICLFLLVWFSWFSLWLSSFLRWFLFLWSDSQTKTVTEEGRGLDVNYDL